MAKFKNIDGYSEYVACEHCGGTKITTVCYAGGTTDVYCTLCGKTHSEDLVFDENGLPVYEDNGINYKLKVSDYGGFGTAYLLFRDNHHAYEFNSQEEALELLEKTKAWGDEVIENESYIYVFDKETNKGQFIFGSLPNDGQYTESA